MARRKNFYAREYLKDIRSPKGFVVLGRSESLNDDLKKKLARRNLTFGNKLQVLTYDDLLNKVETFLEIIKKAINFYSSAAVRGGSGFVGYNAPIG